MRFSDILVEDNLAKDAIIDLLAIVAGEGADSISFEVVQQELAAQGIDIDIPSLFDLSTTLDIVDNVKDDVIYFNTNSERSHHTQQEDPEKAANTVDKMARKQISRNL